MNLRVNLIIKLCIVFAITFLNAGYHTGGPDGFGYKFIDSDTTIGRSFTWIDATSGVEYHLSDDDNVQIQLPFSFPFYNDTLTSIYVVSNGFITTENVRQYRNTRFPVVDIRNLVAPFWDDLYPDGGAIYTMFDTSNNYFVIEWYNVLHYGSGGPYTFEVILEPSGDIVFQYLNVDSLNVNSATIGIQNEYGTNGFVLQYCFNGSPLSPHDNLRIDFIRPYVRGNYLKICDINGIPGLAVKVPVELINQDVISAIEAHIIYDTTKLILDSLSLNDELINFEISSNRINDTIFVVIFSLTGDSLAGGQDTLFFLNFRIDSTVNWGDSTNLQLESTVFADPNGNLLNVDNCENGWIHFEGVRGDLNMDNVINIVDAVRIVNIILNKPPSPSIYERWSADVNNDGRVDITDVLRVLEIIVRER